MFCTNDFLAKKKNNKDFLNVYKKRKRRIFMCSVCMRVQGVENSRHITIEAHRFSHKLHCNSIRNIAIVRLFGYGLEIRPHCARIAVATVAIGLGQISDLWLFVYHSNLIGLTRLVWPRGRKCFFKIDNLKWNVNCFWPQLVRAVNQWYNETHLPPRTYTTNLAMPRKTKQLVRTCRKANEAIEAWKIIAIV